MDISSLRQAILYKYELFSKICIASESFTPVVTSPMQVKPSKEGSLSWYARSGTGCEQSQPKRPPHFVAFYDKERVLKAYFYPDYHGAKFFFWAMVT
jgi:hypothetical protein